MRLTREDLQAIRDVIREETEPKFQSISQQFRDFKEETRNRFNMVDKAIENIVQELVKFTGELHQNHEERISRLEKQLHTHT